MADRRTSPGRAALLALFVAALPALEAVPAVAKPPGGATNSRQAREDAQRGIPYARLDKQLAPQIQRVVNQPSVFRRLPIQVIDCDPKMYHFLLNNPEVVVNIWQVMGITKVQMVRTGPTTYEASDGAGATGTIEIAYSDHELQVVYCEGLYDGPMFNKPIRAQCVLVIKAGYVQETDGRYFVTTRCDAFIHFENVGLELLAKTFQPMVNKSADVNFIETAAFISTVSRTSEVKPAGMAKLGNRLENVAPEVRSQFVELTQQIHLTAQRNRAVAQAQGQASRELRGQNNR